MRLVRPSEGQISGAVLAILSQLLPRLRLRLPLAQFTLLTDRTRWKWGVEVLILRKIIGRVTKPRPQLQTILIGPMTRCSHLPGWAAWEQLFGRVVAQHGSDL